MKLPKDQSPEERAESWEALRRAGYLLFIIFVYMPVSILAGVAKNSD